MPSFGLIYGEFLLELGVGTEGFTTIVGVYMAGYSFICKTLYLLYYIEKMAVRGEGGVMSLVTRQPLRIAIQ